MAPSSLGPIAPRQPTTTLNTESRNVAEPPVLGLVYGVMQLVSPTKEVPIE